MNVADVFTLLVTDIYHLVRTTQMYQWGNLSTKNTHDSVTNSRRGHKCAFHTLAKQIIYDMWPYFICNTKLPMPSGITIPTRPHCLPECGICPAFAVL